MKRRVELDAPRLFAVPKPGEAAEPAEPAEPAEAVEPKDPWRLPADLDDEHRALATEMLDTIQMKAGVLGSDVASVVSVARGYMSVAAMREMQRVASVENDVKEYLALHRTIIATEGVIRRAIADLGLAPGERASATSRKVAAKRGMEAGSRFAGLDLA